MSPILCRHRGLIVAGVILALIDLLPDSMAGIHWPEARNDP